MRYFNKKIEQRDAFWHVIKVYATLQVWNFKFQKEGRLSWPVIWQRPFIIFSWSCRARTLASREVKLLGVSFWMHLWRKDMVLAKLLGKRKVPHSWSSWKKFCHYFGRKEKLTYTNICIVTSYKQKGLGKTLKLTCFHHPYSGLVAIHYPTWPWPLSGSVT